ALEETRRQIQDAFLDETRNLTVSSAEIAIESFRLVLLPVWTVRITRAGQPHEIMLNGQTGAIWGEKPGVKGFLARLFH
ncbi:MAG: hypothetical protein PHQ40_18695, partial [Anaerolineaceae bacterium]|nr:hypothetical protein [Anaerolineaceae bacterium]